MISLPEGHRFHFYRPPCDMRKSFNGLIGIVQNEMGRKLDERSWFIFVNKKRDKVKLLYFCGDGFWIYYKQLAEGTFGLPEGEGYQISRKSLLLLLEGVDLKGAKFRKRYSPKRSGEKAQEQS